MSGATGWAVDGDDDKIKMLEMEDKGFGEAIGGGEKNVSVRDKVIFNVGDDTALGSVEAVRSVGGVVADGNFGIFNVTAEVGFGKGQDEGVVVMGKVLNQGQFGTEFGRDEAFNIARDYVTQ